MKKRLSQLLVFVSLVGLMACVEEEFPTGIGPEQKTPEVIEPPCTYDNWAEIKTISGMSGNVYIKQTQWFDYDEVLLSFSTSPNDLRIQYNERRGFKNIVSQVIDFASVNKSHRIKMDIAFFGSTNRKVNAVSGKLYIVMQPNGSMKLDWCDVKMYDDFTEQHHTTSGGCLVNF